MASSIGIDQQELLSVLSKWWITVAVMGSLLMQLLLLLTGGTRKWSMVCRFVGWTAYNWSDFIASSALGGLAQAAAAGNAQKKEVYAIWAPMLLLHLGAPDNISAYAMEDAELWQRHGLTMLLQIATVIYVVANCARGWKYVLLSICLTGLGSIKYAERALALKRASRADVIESALPIYKYMLVEEHLDLSIKGPVSSSQSLPVSSTPHPEPSYYYIIQGEKQWHRNFLQAGETNYVSSFQDAARRTPELVTLQDIRSSQQLRQTAPSMFLLCAGFALFKLYKRRHTYWRSSIGQFTLGDVDNRSRCINAKLAMLFRRDQLQLLPEYVHSNQVSEEFKIYVFTKALAACRGIPRINQTLSPDWFVPKYNDHLRPVVLAALGADDQVGDQFYIDLEHLMVNWHVATSMCEMLAAHPCPTQHANDAAVPHREHADTRISNDTSTQVGSSNSPAHELLLMFFTLNRLLI